MTGYKRAKLFEQSPCETGCPLRGSSVSASLFKKGYKQTISWLIAGGVEGSTMMYGYFESQKSSMAAILNITIQSSRVYTNFKATYLP